MVNIPKIIWQTYKTYQIPSKWISSPQSIKDLHPLWTYRFMTDADNRHFVSEEYPQYLQLYDRLGQEIKPICSVDMVRCLFLHKYGGIYLDLDYKATKPFDSLFNTNADLYMFKTQNVGGYTNSFMASKPGCIFWIKCIEKMAHRLNNCPWYIFGDVRVLWTTGPGLLTSTVNEYDQPYVTIPAKLGHPCNICDHYLNRVCSEKESYVEELPGSSWTNSTTQFFYFATCRWKELLIVLFIILIIIILYFIVSYSTINKKPI